ncbi:MAG: DUF2905 domain-containing protein [bacterium]|nr:DUF2905 domain-containing protein [bacterium]
MSSLQPFGKIIMIFGIVIFLAGLIISFFDKIPFLGKLPGDITIRRENFTIYFPVVTSIIISILLSLFFYLWNKFKN